MIELIEFTKKYGDFTAVESLNLRIEAGDMFGFIGPNGAGKSTTIRFLATLLKELRRMGKTILISSHILTELADCCTSIGIIERGQLLMHGPIDDVYRRIRGNRIVEIKFVEGLDVGLSIIRGCPQTRDVQV